MGGTLSSEEQPSSSSSSTTMASSMISSPSATTSKKRANFNVDLPPELQCSIPVMEPEEVAKVTISMNTVLEASSSSSSTTTTTSGAQALRDLMDEHGFMIVTDVLSAEEIKRLETSFENDFRRALPEDIDKTKDPLHIDTYPEDIEGHFGNSMIASFGLPHSELSWACRLHPNVQRVYQALHPGEELCASFDNLFLTQKGVPAATTNRRWPHVDTNKYHEKCGSWECYQGIVYIWSSEGDDRSTTVVLPRSHKDVFEALMADKVFHSGRRLYSELLSLSDTQRFESLMARFLAEARRVPVPAGGLLVWSSRTTHQGWTGGPRLAQPVCWEPKSRRTREILLRKAKLALIGSPTTHWASLGQPQLSSGRFVQRVTKKDSGWHWLPSYAIREGGVPAMSDEDFADLVQRAQNEEGLGEDGPATQELLGLLRPEIAKAL